MGCNLQINRTIFVPLNNSDILMNILIVDDTHPSMFEMLKQAGFVYRYEPAFKRTDILTHIADYDGLIIRSKTFIDEEILQKAAKLRFIARAGAGLDLIDIAAAEKRNIKVFAANEGNRDAVAEHAVGMLLALFANIVKADREVRQGIWNREGNRGIELMGKTVGLIGYGFNGSATAQRLSGFGCNVLAYDKYLANYGNAYARQVTLEELMEKAEVISLHVPLTDETRLMVNEDFIERVAHPFFLLNMARGEIVCLESVVNGLKSGKIRGACLDVLENEKLKTLTPAQQAAFDYLCASDRVVLTPHVAGWTQESYIKINEVLMKHIVTFP